MKGCLERFLPMQTLEVWSNRLGCADHKRNKEWMEEEDDWLRPIIEE